MRYVLSKLVLVGIALLTASASFADEINFCSKVIRKFQLEDYFATPGVVCSCPSPDIQNEYEFLLCLEFFDVITARQMNNFGDVPFQMPDEVYLRDAFVGRGPKIPKPTKPKPKPPSLPGPGGIDGGNKGGGNIKN